MLLHSQGGASLGACRAPAWAPGAGAITWLCHTPHKWVAAAMTPLLSTAHKPSTGLGRFPLRSQPMVGLPGVCSACCPRHHPHFHGPADHSCHP